MAGDINSTGQYKVDGTTVINTDGNFEVHDTRSDTPSNDIGLKGVEFEFKQNTTNGLNDGGTYNGVMTFQIWNDSSGGNINRLGFTNTSQIYLQSQQIGNSLTGWRKILQKDTNSIINLDSISGSAADTTITGSNNITIRAEASSGGTTRKSEIEMLWATVLKFTKTPEVKEFFELWEKIILNYNYYAKFFQRYYFVLLL